MISWLLRKPWWFNLLAAIALSVTIFFLWLSSLSWFTGHGKSATVPSVIGLSYEQAKSLLISKGFSIQVDDSIYSDTLQPLHVMKQLPASGEIVKEGRTIFLTISRAVPPEVDMPNLNGQSFRNAEMILKSLDLKVGDTTFKRDFARYSVLEQLYEGALIAPGTKIRKGSSIDLVLGNGVGEKEMLVPNLMGMLFSDVKLKLEELGLGVGVLVMPKDLTDTLSGYVIRQEPTPSIGDSVINRIRSGQLMDIWLGVEPLKKDTLELP
jgi:beta-lactam-binding protein with PASTA domain